MAKNEIELWEGYSVTVNEQLLDDFDYIADLDKARRENDIATIISMYFALVGGQEVYDKVREHITGNKGYFSQAELTEVIKKISNFFPKAGLPAERRSWQTSK